MRVVGNYRFLSVDKRKAPGAAGEYVTGRGIYNEGLGRLCRKRLAMVGRCIRLAVCSLVLCFGGSAGAEERCKTLYAAQGETCHKSPQAVTTFHGGLDLKTFLGELHHADTPESAASIAAYLKGLEQAAQSRADEPAKKRRNRRTKQRGEAPSTINAASTDNDPLKQTMKMLFGGANSSNENH